MKIKEFAGINHIIIDEMAKDEKELYKLLEDKVFITPYRTETFYPVVVNNNIIFVFKNSQNYIHFYLKNIRYRFNKKQELVRLDTLINNNDYKELIEQVRRDNVKIFQ